MVKADTNQDLINICTSALINLIENDVRVASRIGSFNSRSCLDVEIKRTALQDSFAALIPPPCVMKDPFSPQQVGISLSAPTHSNSAFREQRSEQQCRQVCIPACEARAGTFPSDGGAALSTSSKAAHSGQQRERAQGSRRTRRMQACTRPTHASAPAGQAPVSLVRQPTISATHIDIHNLLMSMNFYYSMLQDTSQILLRYGYNHLGI